MLLIFFFMMIHYFLGVGFFMFIERKILGLAQFREGPSKVLFKGNLQFIMDLIKLLLKSWNELIFMGGLLFYLFMPMVLFINMIMMWVLYPFFYVIINIKIGIIFLIVLMTLKMIYFMFMIYLIYSVYSMLSMIRMMIQVISYDIILILVLILYFVKYVNLNFIYFFSISMKFNFTVFFSLMVFVFWIIGIMAELIRLPFDFYEGESELISGFNTEFSSLLFMILVLIEYVEIVYFLMLTLFLFIISVTVSMLFYVVLFFFVFFFIWIRVFFVRYRLDKMMLLLWKFIFPLCMVNLMSFYYINFL